VKRIRMLTIALALFGFGCSTARFRYDATLVREDGTSSPFYFEKSYPVDDRTKTLCWVTGIFYGGWCWAYLTMPNSGQRTALKSDATFAAQAKYQKSQLTPGRYSSVGWGDSPQISSFEIKTSPSVDTKVASALQVETEKIIGVQFKDNRFYAGGDLLGAKPGDTLTLVDFEINSIDEFATSSTLYFGQDSKVYPIILRIGFVQDTNGKLSSNSIGTALPNDYWTASTSTENALYRKDPIAKYRRNPRIVRAVREGEIYVGMPAEAAVVSYGTPKYKNFTTTQHGQHEQWVYNDDWYVYVENGAVTAWQGSRR
jgi:hypothetical protein